MKLSYRFNDVTLLEQALTHRSASSRNNERLEFLGDSILNFTITSALYERLPDATEGELSRIRASLVNGNSLAKIAEELELSGHLNLGSGERKSGGNRRMSIQADATEAIFGAVLLDGGINACQDLILSLFHYRLNNLPDPEDLKDPKTKLQEYLQGRGLGLPVYEIVSEQGKDHAKHFVVSCLIEGLGSYTGEGSSRRKAEQQAAATTLDAIKDDG